MMKKLFTILWVLAFSNTFGAYPGFLVEGDNEEDHPTFDQRKEAINEFLYETVNSEVGTEIPVPYSSEIHIVKSNEEIINEMLTHPNNRYDLLMGNLLQKQNTRLLQGIKQIPNDMPQIALDPSGMTGLDTLSERQLMSMIYVQLTYDFSQLTTAHLNSHAKTCYNQMFEFLRRAKWEAEDIWDGPLRRAARSAIEKAMETLAETGSPKKAIVFALYKGIIKFALNVNENLTEMYNHLEAAIMWADGLDDCGTEQAKRMGKTS